MSASATPVVYRSETQPEWGMGVVIEESPEKLVMVFEHGGPRTFVKRLLKGLAKVTLDSSEAVALDEKLRGRKRLVAVTSADRKKLATKAAKASAAKAIKTAARQAARAVFASFEEELAFFDKLYPEGFADEKYIAEERGHPDATGKAGYKHAAIAFTREQLAPARFKSATPEELFEAARKAISMTNIPFPTEGAIPFGNIAAEDRPPLLEALKALLHGEGEYGTRFEQYVHAMKLKDKKGSAKAVTWPLASLLPALYNPEEHVAVKPTAFGSQAAMLGIPVDKSQRVDAAGYQLFLKVAQVTKEKLTAAGHKPRDLMDVYSFIFRTHAEKPAP